LLHILFPKKQVPNAMAKQLSSIHFLVEFLLLRNNVPNAIPT